MLVGSLVLFLIRNKFGLIYFIITTLIIVVFPTVLFVLVEFVVPGLIIAYKKKKS
jgi:hypothetical protein